MAKFSVPVVGTGGMTWSAEEGRESCMVFGSRVPGSCWEKVRCKKKAELSMASFWSVLFDAVPGCEFGYRVLVFATGFTNDKRNVFATSQLEVWM